MAAIKTNSPTPITALIQNSHRMLLGYEGEPVARAVVVLELSTSPASHPEERDGHEDGLLARAEEMLANAEHALNSHAAQSALVAECLDFVRETKCFCSEPASKSCDRCELLAKLEATQ